MKREYTIFKPKNRKTYQYRLGNDPKRIARSTSQTTYAQADNWVRKHLEEFLKQKEEKNNPILRDYAEPFYTWDRCPHVTRYRADDKSITIDHVKIARSRLKNYILPHAIAQKKIKDITIDDIENFKIDLRTKHELSRSSVNRIMSVLKVIFNEAYYRKHITYNPTLGIGKISETPRERNIFTPQELITLFPEESPGPWRDHELYTCFLIAATTGMCRGEILALQWKNIDYVDRIIHVETARKVSEIGNPKWNRFREPAITPRTLKALEKLYTETYFNKPEDYLFSQIDHTPRGFTWWRKNFNNTINKLGWTGRNLTPHSFRHTLVTYLRSRGYDLDLIQELIGHSGGDSKERRKTRVTNIYTHWQLDDTHQLIEPIEKLFQGE